MGPMEITYRKILASDSDVIKDLFYYAIHIPPGAPPLDKSIINTPALFKYHADWGHKTDMGYMASSGENTIGAAWLRLLTGDNKGYGYVDEATPELTIAVLPRYRALGIGKNLLKRTLDMARQHFRQVSLSVSKGNPAYRLYDRMGFVSVAENDQDFIMVKKL